MDRDALAPTISNVTVHTGEFSTRSVQTLSFAGAALAQRIHRRHSSAIGTDNSVNKEPKTGHVVPPSSLSAEVVTDSRTCDLENAFSCCLGPSKTSTVGLFLATILNSAVASMLNGIVTIETPQIGRDFHMSSAMMLWPVASASLASGSAMLCAAIICDFMGPRSCAIFGTILQTGFAVAAGLSRSSTEFIIFRGLGGLATAFCLPSSTSIIVKNFTDTRRSLAFACLGAAQPFGFALGLVCGGVMTEKYNWHLGFFVGAGLTAIALPFIISAVPPDPPLADDVHRWRDRARSMWKYGDWIGALIASVSVTLSTFVFAELSQDPSQIKQGGIIICLVTAVVLLLALVAWTRLRERSGLSTLIPNLVRGDRHFIGVCLAVFLAWGTFNAQESIQTLYFQNVQQLQPIQTSLRFLPCIIVGTFAEVLAGWLLSKFPATYIVNLGLWISCGGSLLLTYLQKSSIYWEFAFPANMCSPIGVDSLFTVANLVICLNYKPESAAVAAGLFNVIAGLGKSFGVATSAIVMRSYSTPQDPDGMTGYHAAFYYCFAINCVVSVCTFYTLRDLGAFPNGGLAAEEEGNREPASI